ncbi:uncharacterized protein nsl1 isoform X1 [Panulirus ornatus]|uniref:uncharacterized protein nsl1 isoform X1 n=1 Tax=Panulirus ornatus TaxID=150431 RepID=UPI003A8AA115
MAPALTEASDPHTFHVAAHHHPSGEAPPGPPPTSPPTAHLPLQYGGLKEPHDCTDAHLAAALANGPCRLLPPGGLACGGGREGCDPPPRPHAAHTTMDPPPGLPPPTETDDTTPTSSSSNSSSSSSSSMGQDTTTTATAPNKSPRPSPPPPQDGDFLALIGRDFANMNDIIDTLTRLADNPEVLAAVDTAATMAQPALPREERARLLLEELGRRQWQMERRQARLQRRLRRVTARGLGASVSGQLREVLEYAHVTLAQQREHASTSEEGPTPPTPPEVGVEALRADAMRTMSTSALVNLVRRVEASQGLARLAAASQRPTRSQPPTPAPTLPDQTRAELAAVGAELEAATHAHTHHDSDATETSSGGESCDELEGYNDSNTNFSPVQERAYYRYCKARAWVASKWTWLQAQVADLEYRILQQHKIYAHVRNSKGAVQLEEGSRWRGMILRDPAHLDAHDPALTCLAAPTARTAVNGYHSRVEGSVDGGIPDTSYVSARTQGLRSIKRRRLVRAGAGLCAGLRRGGGGGRIPAVQCKCVPPLTCVLCTRLQGLVPPAAPPDPHIQPANERHARVDPTYHPVLSQPADVSLSERFDAMLKTTDWQRQILTAKTIQPLPVTRTNRETSHVEKKKKKDKDRKKDYKKHKKEGKGRITLNAGLSPRARRSKLKKSLLTGELVRDGEFKRKRMSAQEALLAMKRVRVDDDDDASSVYGSSLHSSPSASPAPIDRSAHKRHSSSSIQKNKQSTSSNSYDIDNIVIPYSMAASTRVEKLEYKEIPTPKWRIVPLIPNSMNSASGTSQEEEFEEDISEEAVAARHSRSEELERKKFLQYLHMHVTSRSSRSRRTDSSGTNTPDHPLSPRPPDPASDTISPLATPPTTPLAPSEDSNQSSSLPAIASIPNSSSYHVSSVLSSSFTTLSSQAGLVNSSPQLSVFHTTSQLLPNQLLIHNPQLGNSAYTQLPASTSLSTSTSLATTASASTLSSLLSGSRRNRTFSSSSSKTRGFLNTEEGLTERLEGVIPYEQRVFPLGDAEYLIMTRETDDCDIGPPSPPLDSSTHEANVGESGRSSPMSEVTDSAPEDDGGFDDMAAPKWTISGLKDATGQCVLQIHRN